MNRNEQNQDSGHYSYQDRHMDEDQYRGAYRLDADRGNEYDNLNRRNNFNDNDIRYDYRSRNYYGSDQDRRSGSSDNGPDYGRDRDREGERFDSPNVFPGESNNSLRNAARNQGNMGSYGGAQGWGTSRNGSHQSSSGANQWASGHGRADGDRPENKQIYGAYRDHNSFAEGEREQYDGTSRYGTQGADNSRVWEPAGRAGENGAVHSFGTEHTSRRNDDSQYEIYDSARANYNRGQYGNNLGGDSYMSSNYDRNAGGNASMGGRNETRRERYNQQGQDNRRENYGNMAGSLSYGNDRDYRSEEGRERRFDPMSGHTRDQGTQPPSREDFSW